MFWRSKWIRLSQYPFFEPLKIQDIILFISSYLFFFFKPCILSNVEYNYENDSIITQIPIYAFFCGLVMIMIIKILYVPNVEVKVGLWI
jgi:hypothetical protein